MNADTPRIAVFDLDGTICPQDTFRAFLGARLLRSPVSVLRAWPLPVHVIAHLAGRCDEGALKERFVRALLSGLAAPDVVALADAVAAGVAGPWLREGARRAVDDHRARGDRLVLATASLDLWVEAVAARLGFDDVTCTRVERLEDGAVGLSLSGDNCRGPIKLDRLRELLGDRPAAHVVAYSDHHADLPLLTWADEGVAVNPTRRLRRLAPDLGLRVVDWD